MISCDALEDIIEEALSQEVHVHGYGDNKVFWVIACLLLKTVSVLYEIRQEIK